MILEYITVASGINFLFLAIALLLKKTPNKKSNQILVVLFLLMAVYCSLVAFHNGTIEHKSYSLLRYYSPIDGLFLLSMGPCLYFYILSVLNKPTPVFKWKNLLHLLPFIPYISFFIYFLTLPFQQRIDWLIRDFHSGTTEMNWLNGIIYSQTITYLILCYRLVSKQLKITDIVKFENATYDISWLNRYLIITLSFIILTLPFCFIIANERTSIIIGQLGMDIQFVYMFFKWTLHTDTTAVNTLEPIPNINSVLPDNSASDPNLQKLLLYMEEKQPYLNEECSLQTVSQQTGIPQYQLTNMLNCNLQKTFPDFINQYRINAIQQLLLSMKSETVTIESIATECGFGSKSAFHRAFKKFSNNLTPSEFIRQHKSTE